MNIKEAEAAFEDLARAIERDREVAVQRSPQARRDLDIALSTAQAALEHLKNGRADAAANLWKRNAALRLVAKHYDLEFDRLTAAFE